MKEYARTGLIVGAFILVLNISAMGQSAKSENRIATVDADRFQIRWEPQVPYSRLVLTVSAPDGHVFREEFDARTKPSFRLTDLPDGHYNYELRLVPAFANGVREALAAARERGDEATAQEALRNSGQLPEPVVQTGSFSLDRGTVFFSRIDLTEPRSFRVPGSTKGLREGRLLRPEDVVVPDDQIVQGSLCVGLDCVNNESFGFDTIRLKENNTRIKFEDTSTAAGFPTNDWQLTANDSASGGAAKFSIDDIDGAKTPFTITAGAPTGSIFVNSSGHLGLRTTTPVLDVHMNTGDTPAIRFEQNSGGGFTAQTWDVAGNEANFFVRDVTGGSRLPFRIRPGAPTSSIDISASGNVGIGTASPNSKLTVNGVVEITNPGSSQPFGLVFPNGFDSLHIVGSTASVDEDSTAIVSLSNFVVGVRDGSTGTVNVRYNLPATASLSTIGSAFRAFRVRYRDSDGAGAGARVLFTVHSTDINVGGNNIVFTFDSNNEAPSGLAFVTVTKCDNTPGTEFDFTTKGYWIEASVTRGSAGDSAQLAHIQIVKTTTCP